LSVGVSSQGSRNFMIGGCLRADLLCTYPPWPTYSTPCCQLECQLPPAPRTIKRRFALPFQPLGGFNLDGAFNGIDRVLFVPLIGFLLFIFRGPGALEQRCRVPVPSPGHSQTELQKRIIFDSFRNAERALADGIGVFILSAASSVPLFLGSWKYASCLALTSFLICAEALVLPRFVDHYVIYPSGNGQ